VFYDIMMGFRVLGYARISGYHEGLKILSPYRMRSEIELFRRYNVRC